MARVLPGPCGGSPGGYGWEGHGWTGNPDKNHCDFFGRSEAEFARTFRKLAILRELAMLLSDKNVRNYLFDVIHTFLPFFLPRDAVDSWIQLEFFTFFLGLLSQIAIRARV